MLFKSSSGKSGSFRRSRITDEHLPIHPDLLGLELASVRRRALALVVDLLGAFALVIPWILFWGFLALHIQAPLVIPYAIGELGDDMTEAERDQARDQARADLIKMIERHRPDLLPSGAHEAIQNEDYVAAGRLITNGSNIRFNLGRGESSTYDQSTNTYFLTDEILFGPLSRAFGGVSGFLLYFTLFVWWRQGRTPGKWLAGIRAVRLDGARLSLWDAFGRAGGYSASFSTFGLGFLEAVWNPNRQTIHDRICGTVVIRAPRRRTKRVDEPVNEPATRDTHPDENVADPVECELAEREAELDKGGSDNESGSERGGS